MIANIDSQSDITAYLNGEEIGKLSNNETLSGILVRGFNETLNPVFGSIEIKVGRDENNFLKSNGINVDDSEYWGKKKFELRVTVNNYYFGLLQERGKTGTRQNMPPDGSKINLRNISVLDGIERYWVNEMIEISTRATTPKRESV